MWPTTRIEIESYPGWFADVHDLTVAEVAVLEQAMEERSMDSMSRALLPSVKVWNFVGRDGQVLPLDMVGINGSPIKAVKELLLGVLGAMNREPIPKEMTSTE